MTDLEQRLIDAAIAFGNAVKSSRDYTGTDGQMGMHLAIALANAQRELHTAAKLVAAEARK